MGGCFSHGYNLWPCRHLGHNPKSTCAHWELPEKGATTLRGISFNIINPEVLRKQRPCLGVDLCRTPPFSSEEEQEDDDLIRAYASPGPLPVPPSQNKGSFGKNTVKSDADGTEGSEIEDTDDSPKPTGELLPWKTLWKLYLGRWPSPGCTDHWKSELWEGAQETDAADPKGAHGKWAGLSTFQLKERKELGMIPGILVC